MIITLMCVFMILLLYSQTWTFVFFCIESNAYWRICQPFLQILETTDLVTLPKFNLLRFIS